MCGLVGMFGNLAHADERAFKDMLIVSSLRGPHSTGIGYTDGDKKTGFFKGVGNPYELLSDKGSTEAVFNPWLRHTVVMGHNRYATVGAVNTENAHPFMHSTPDKSKAILLAHNGGVHNYREIARGQGFDTDSEHIAYAFSRAPERDVLKEMRGAFALTWYNSQNKTFNIVRNDQRPLWYVKHKHRNAWYYGSEGALLLAVLHRNNISVEDLQQLKDGTMMTWSHDERTKLEFQEVALYSFQHSYDYHGRGGRRREWDQSTGQEGWEWEAGWHGGIDYNPTSRTSGESRQKDREVSTTEPQRESTNRKVVALRQKTTEDFGTIGGRNYKRGHEFLREHGIRINKDFVRGWFFYFEPYNSAKSWARNGYPEMQYRGKARGVFVETDSMSSQEVAIESANFDLAKSGCHTESGDFKHGNYSFKIGDIWWDVKDEMYIIRAIDMEPIEDAEHLKLYREIPRVPDKWNTEKNTDEVATAEVVTPSQLKAIGPPSPVQSVPRNSPVFVDREEEERVKRKKESPWFEDPDGTVYVMGPYQIHMPFKRWSEKTRYGCSKCSCDLKIDDALHIGWVGSDSPLCPDCTELFSTQPDFDLGLTRIPTIQ